MEKTYLFASTNRGKQEEVKAILDVNILMMDDFDCLVGFDVIEDKDTLVENAVKKAAETFAKIEGAYPVIADDSGMFVRALNYEPGVRSARYAGDHDFAANTDKVLKNLASKENSDRVAYMETVMVLYDGKKFVIAKGRLNGTIIEERRGDNGFGYDNIFVPGGYDKTLAEMTPEEKNSISHRKLALENLKRLLES